MQDKKPRRSEAAASNKPQVRDNVYIMYEHWGMMSEAIINLATAHRAMLLLSTAQTCSCAICCLTDSLYACYKLVDHMDRQRHKTRPITKA